MKAHGPWQIVSSRDIYRDSWIDVRRDDVLRPDGQPGTHCVVTLKSGVSVLAVDDTQHVYLTEEFHYAIGRVATEVVSGGIEPDETPEQTVRRELREELGLVADRWTSWGNLDPISSVIAAPVALFLAEGLTAVQRAPEPTELIRTVRMPLSEALAAVLDGRITHAPSCVLILRAARHYRVV